MRTILDAGRQITDRRSMWFEVRFFSLTSEQADDLARDYYQYVIESFFDDFIIDWEFEDRKMKDL